jgi:hypothetical protein
MAADLVVGMNSILLVEAAFLGALAVSIQPSLVGEDVLPTNTTRATIPVYDAAQVDLTLRNLLTDAELRARHLTTVQTMTQPAGAAERAAAVVRELVAQGR